MSLTLYEMASSYRSFLSMMETGELDAETAEIALTSIEGAIQEKVPNIAKAYKILEGEADIIDREIERLQNEKKKRTNGMKWLKEYVQKAMEATGIEKIERPDPLSFGARLQNNPPAVEITDSNKVPAEYKVITYSTDNTRILADLKAGKEIPGAALKQGKHVRW